jgi:hypothetical protein
MSSPSSSASTLPVSWADVLDRVAAALRTAEEQALHAEQALTPRPSAPSSTIPSGLERLHSLQDGLAAAEQVAVTAESASRQSEESLAEWLSRAGAARGNLATAADAGV